MFVVYKGNLPFMERWIENAYRDPLSRALYREDAKEAINLLQKSTGDTSYWNRILIAALPLHDNTLIQQIRSKGVTPTSALEYVSTLSEAKGLEVIGAKVDPNATYSGSSLLAHHIVQGNAEIVEWLFQKMPNPYARAKDYTTLLPIVKGYLKQVEETKANTRPEVYQSEKQRYTQTIALLKKYGAKEVVKEEDHDTR